MFYYPNTIKWVTPNMMVLVLPVWVSHIPPAALFPLVILNMSTSSFGLFEINKVQDHN